MASYIFEEGYPGPKVLHPIHNKPQLLVNILDGMARVRPAALYGEYPVSLTGYDKGLRRITHGQLANAVNGAAWWLTEKLGPGKNFQTLCYMGWNDVRYIVFVLGAVKAGYKLLLTSPRNSPEGNKNLFDTMDCRVLLTTKPRPPTVEPVLRLHELQIFSIPSIEELFDKTHEHFPYDKTFEGAKKDPLVALHTLGTTGLPKPLVYTHEFAAAFVRCLQMDPPEGFESMEKLGHGNRVFILSPPFHASAMFVMMEGISGQTTFVFPPAATFPTAAFVKEGLMHTSVTGVLGGASMVAECARDPELLDFLSTRLTYMSYGGGDVAQAFGDTVSAKLKLYTSHGSSELGSFPGLRRRGVWDPKDWKYFQAHPAAGLQFRPYDEGVYEAFVVRNLNLEEEQPVFKLFPELQEYATKDLFSPHPTKPDTWMYKARSDDMINFSAGMANPYIMEHAVLDISEVSDAVMVSVQKIGLEDYAQNTALLVELKSTEHIPAEKQSELIEKLWPIVEEANKNYRAGACISKFRILLVDPQKPLPRNGKGTVQRAKVLQLYAEELDKLY
ncbi:hypothetical protein G7Y89_g10695 [Cudoniella acicularis]|uniref:AMP-dependent synthetase/ligase domain-containing protein n=1 Tax=Cudoniella acicularis TaxID=354080 RepID=A0A8H4REK6_9HELO|nr:hypothetical protein G7Y89_g10695 [Cudoniella acicularis]